MFAVVGVSMRSSVSLLVWRGYAVPLLGLNCFLLGVLTSPMLLGIARWLAVALISGRAPCSPVYACTTCCVQ
jgi:hypothetical protein